MERDRRRFTPDGRPRAEPGGTSGGEPRERGAKPGEPAPAEPRPAEETAPAEETGPAEEIGPAASGASRPKPAEPPAADAKRRSAASAPKDASAGAKRPAPPAETGESAPPKPRAGNEGREHLVGFLLTLAETYLRILAARAAEPAADAKRDARAGQDPLTQAFVGLEQVVSYFRLLTDAAAPRGSADAEAPAAGEGDPRLGQLVQLLLAHADFSLRAAAAPPAADPTGEGETGSGEAAALRGAEALGAFQEVIGMLEALEQHTRSRQTEEESRMMSRALYQMRMDYLALAGAPGGAPAVR